MVKNILDQIYNISPDTLNHLTHSLTKQSFRFLNDVEMVGQAQKINELVLSNDPNTILYSDTGAWPLAYICQALLGKDSRLWLPMKCPREAFGNYDQVILYLLTAKEKSESLPKNESEKLKEFCKLNKIFTICDARMSRKKLISLYSEKLNSLFFAKLSKPLKNTLRSLDETSLIHELFSLLLVGTKFYKLLLGKVVYIDEYVDSGVTLSNTVNVLKCFNPKIDLSIVAYHIFAYRRDLALTIQALHAADEGIGAFMPGAYPYENRLDIIGHFYLVGKDIFRKVEISNICKRFKKSGYKNIAVQNFLENCFSFIEKHKLIELFNAKIKIKEIVESNIIDKRELLRYLLYLFEDGLANSKISSQMLWNLFDMHGPAWSPLHDSYHFDFWNASLLCGGEVRDMKEFLVLRREYMNNRRQIFQNIVNICDRRHRAWMASIKNIINEK